MKNRFLSAVKSATLYHLLFVLILSFVIYNFILHNQYELAKLVFNNYLKSTILVFLSIALLFFILISISLLFTENQRTSLTYSGIVLFPILLLSLPRSIRQDLSVFIPLSIVLATQVCFFVILFRGESVLKTAGRKEKIILVLFIILYFIFFSIIGVKKFNTFSLFNPKDFAIYNQTFWNTIQGKFFLNSTYGSNFTCHNTLFFWALVPLYYILPHPLTLLFLKILLLAISVIPFYMIAKSILEDIPLIAIVLAFMFYPYLISQNLTPPHEITYSPFFLLFTYYFFKTNKFLPFLIFLLISISIKEHVSLLAITFGVFAIFKKKSFKWIFTPLFLGIAWAIISVLIIWHFQKIYDSHPDAGWFLIYLKRNSLAYIVLHSNISSWYKINCLSCMFFSLGVIPPLLSPVTVLGLPELFINLLSDRPAILCPPWHYNIIVSCFLLVATLYGLKKISNSKWIRYLKINNRQVVVLLSIFILSSTLIYSYLWLELLKYPKDYTYVNTLKKALSMLPENEFVTAPRNAAIHISSREKYSLLGEGKLGDYILTDQQSQSLLSDEVLKDYIRIFDKDGIKVFRKPR